MTFQALQRRSRAKQGAQNSPALQPPTADVLSVGMLPGPFGDADNLAATADVDLGVDVDVDADDLQAQFGCVLTARDCNYSTVLLFATA